MQRTGFKPKAPQRPRRDRSGEFATFEPRPRQPAEAMRVDDGKARMTVPVPKEEPARHEGYRRLVAALPCARCRVDGFSQAAHPNTGKGMAMKTDDRLCFPLCGPRYGEVGCHARLDQGALFDKATRRAAEERWSRETRARIVAAGEWPAGLGMLEVDRDAD